MLIGPRARDLLTPATRTPSHPSSREEEGQGGTPCPLPGPPRPSWELRGRQSGGGWLHGRGALAGWRPGRFPADRLQETGPSEQTELAAPGRGDSRPGGRGRRAPGSLPAPAGRWALRAETLSREGVVLLQWEPAQEGERFAGWGPWQGSRQGGARPERPRLPLPLPCVQSQSHFESHAAVAEGPSALALGCWWRPGEVGTGPQARVQRAEQETSASYLGDRWGWVGVRMCPSLRGGQQAA